MLLIKLSGCSVRSDASHVHCSELPSASLCGISCKERGDSFQPRLLPESGSSQASSLESLSEFPPSPGVGINSTYPLWLRPPRPARGAAVTAPGPDGSTWCECTASRCSTWDAARSATAMALREQQQRTVRAPQLIQCHVYFSSSAIPDNAPQLTVASSCT